MKIVSHIPAFLAFAFSATLALANTPEERARAAVRSGNEKRLIEVLISSPTEEVLLAAADWTGSHNRILVGLVRPLVERSPKTRELLRKRLQSNNAKFVNWAMELLSSSLQTEPLLEEKVYNLAKAQHETALELLGNNSNWNPRYRELLLSILRDQRVPAHFRYRLRHHVADLMHLPEVREFVGVVLREEQQPDVLVDWIKYMNPLGFRDPKLLAQIETIIDLPLTPVNFELHGLVSILLLDHDPTNPDYLDHFARVAFEALVQVGSLNWEAIAFLSSMEVFVGREPRLSKVFDEAYPAVLATLKKEEVNWDSLYRKVFRLYILNFRDRPGGIQKIEKMFRSSSPPVASILTIELVLFYDRLSRSLQSLAEANIHRITADDLIGKSLEGARINPLMRAIAIRDEQSESGTGLQGALRILKEMSRQDPAEVERYHTAMSRTRPEKPAEIVSSEKRRDLDRLLVKVKRTPSHPSTQSISKRELLFSKTPPRGWKSIAQLVGHTSVSDPFAFSEEYDDVTRHLAENGLVYRRKILDLARENLQQQGLEFSALDWLYGKYNARLEQIKTFRRQRRLTPAEKRQTANAAMNRLRSEFPQLSLPTLHIPKPEENEAPDEEVSTEETEAPTEAPEAVKKKKPSPPPISAATVHFEAFKIDSQTLMSENLNRYIREEEENLIRRSLETRSIENEAISDAWRQLMTRELQDRFRITLRTIMDNKGVLVASDPWASSKAQEVQILVENLPEIQIMPYPKTPPYVITIEWRGQIKRLKLIPPTDGVASLDHLATDTCEVAALTLGSERKLPLEMGRVVAIARTFEASMHAFQDAANILREQHPKRVGEELKSDSFAAEQRLHRRLVQIETNTPVLGLLWDAVSRDPEFWRRREEAALDDGRPLWDFAETSAHLEIAAGSYGLSGSPFDLMERMAAEQGRDDLTSDRFDPLLHHDGKIHTLEEWQKNTRIFSVESKGWQTSPTWFSVRPILDFVENASHEVLGVPFESEDTTVVIHTKMTVGVRPEFPFVILPTPIDEDEESILSGLRVFDGDGTRLYPETDYSVLKGGGQYALFFKTGRVARVRFSAEFVGSPVFEEPHELPDISPEKVKQAADLLSDAGFSVLPEALDNLLRAAGNSPIGIHEVTQVFRRTSLFAENADLHLGEVYEQVPLTNPFRSSAQFLDSAGIFCAQGPGANQLLHQFLEFIWGLEVGVRLEPRAVLVRQPDSRFLTFQSGYRIIAMHLANRITPIFLDGTPEASREKLLASMLEERKMTGSQLRARRTRELKKGRGLLAPLGKLFRMLTSRRGGGVGNRGEGESAGPAWAPLVRGQLPEPPKELPQMHGGKPITADPNSLEVTHARRLLSKSRSDLRKAAAKASEEGMAPSPEEWDKTEPLQRANLLASIFDRLLAGENLETLREPLYSIDLRFRSMDLSTRDAVLRTIEAYVREKRTQFEVGVNKPGPFTHYRVPAIQDGILNVYRQIEEITATPQNCGTVLINEAKRQQEKT